MLLKPLLPGDTIAIAATARKITKAELEPAISIFESWRLKVVLADNIGQEYHQFAGTDAQRIQALQKLIDNPEINAIICARGGYGTVRIVDEIDFSSMLQNPKWIIGYSDITVLHSKLHNLGMPTLHATMPINMQPDKIDPQSILALQQTLFEGICPPITTAAHQFNKAGTASAPLVGGNLSVLYSQLSSDTDIDTSGKILFLEDLDEYLYHIDRMMMALKRSGKLSQLAGLVVGGMSDMKDNTVPFGSTAYEIIYQHTKQYEYPIAMGLQAGHETRNLPLILGTVYSLNVDDNGSTLKVE
jgi:muramoyltetrapeptide carboxypeptidase